MTLAFPAAHEAARPHVHRVDDAVSLCLAALNFYPVYAGPAIRFHRYLPAFASYGVSAHVFAGTPELIKAEASGVKRDWGEWEYGRVLAATEPNGAALYQTRLPDTNKRRRSKIFAKALVEHCRRPETHPDVVQLLDSGPLWTIPLLKLRRLDVSVVYTATMLPDLGNVSAVRAAVIQRKIAFSMRPMDAVVVSSGVMAEQMRQMGVRAPVHVIPNGVDTDRFRALDGGADRRRVREELGIGHEDAMALFVGPIVPRKGIDLLLEAWTRLCKELPRLHLVLAGPRLDITHPANRSFHQEVCRMVKESAAPKRVHFTGMIENVEEYMRAADVFVFPSRREGMPNVVPEAMASGLPVVMTPFIGLPSEFGEAGVHYRLVDFDADSLADGIAEVLGDREPRGAMSSAGRSWTRQHLGLERSVERYAELYRHLAHQRSAESR